MIRRPASRPLPWERYGDLRSMNTKLVIVALFSNITSIILGVMLITIYLRPPAILSETDGVVTWRSTEAFRLRSDMVKQFLSMTLGQIYNLTPSDYDITPAREFLVPSIADRLSMDMDKEVRDSLGVNRRKMFEVVGTKRVIDSDYPQYTELISKCEETTVEDSKDISGNVVTQSKTEVVFVLTYLTQKVPTPANPWGLYVVGLSKGDSDKMVHTWDSAVPLTEPKKENQKGGASPTPQNTK